MSILAKETEKGRDTKVEVITSRLLLIVWEPELVFLDHVGDDDDPDNNDEMKRESSSGNLFACC